MKVGLVGWNGMMNVGDDAMTAVIIRKLTQIYGTGIEFHFYNSIDKKMPLYINDKISYKGLPFFDQINKVKGLRKIFANCYYPFKFKKSKNLILIGGGSIIHSTSSSNAKLKVVQAAKKANSDVTIGAIGVSIGPFKNDREFESSKRFLKSLDFVVVRDTRSFKVLQQMNLEIDQYKAPDLAFILPKLADLNISKRNNEHKVLGISLRTGHLDDDRYFRYVSIIKYWLSLSQNNKVKLFNFSELPAQNDHKHSKFLKELLDEKNLRDRVDFFRYSLNPLDYYQEIMNCQVMVCMRLHAAIIGYSVKTPVLIDSYHQKCKDLADELQISSSLIGEDDISEIEVKLKTIYQNEAGAFDPYSTKYDQVIENASAHFRYLCN